MSQVDPYVVHLQDGALAEVGAIIGQFSASRLYFVVDESAYAASGAATVLEPCFQDRAVTRFTGFDLNPKLHDIERGIEQFRDADPELVIALGGGGRRLIWASLLERCPVRTNRRATLLWASPQFIAAARR